MTDQSSIPLAQPDIDQTDCDAVLDVLHSNRLSLGPYKKKFEQSFSNWIGTKHGIATSSGTGALHLILTALLQRCSFDAENHTPEIITTPLSFVASTTTILHANAKPVFVDIDPRTMAIDPSKLEEVITPKTVGILPVHLFGIPADMPAIQNIANQHDLFIVEDACEAPGARLKGQNVGTFSDAASFAFYPNKQLTSGEGGMITTDDSELAETLESLSNQGRDADADWLKHDKLGFNYRMSELHAALGYSQLQRLPSFLNRREQIAKTYNEKLRDIEEITTLPSFSNRTISWFVFVVKLNSNIHRKRLQEILHNKGIETGTYFPCIHEQPFFQNHFPDFEESFPVAEEWASRTLALPFFNDITENQINTVVKHLQESIRQL